jgi:hypothetical protein
MGALHTHRRSITLPPLTAYRGPIARGYVPAGDSRLVDYLDDASPLWRYSPTPGWLEDGPNGHYYQSHISYTDQPNARATIRYYGGGFIVMGHTLSFLSDADIYVNGLYNNTVSYYSPDPIDAHPLLTVQLPEGFHTVEFRLKIVGNRMRMVNDGIVLLSK